MTPNAEATEHHGAQGPDPARAALDARVLAWLREPLSAQDAAPPDDERFDELARTLFGFQFEHCVPYRRFCEARGRTPANLQRWSEIPAIPAAAFKELPLRSFSRERICRVFRTSGTTATQRGALALDTLELYEASLLPSFRRGVLPDLGPGARARLRILAPAPDDAPDSSLSHMFGVVLRELGDERSGFDVRDGALDVRGLHAALVAACDDGVPVALCGTAFAFVHLLDAFAARGVRLVLPPGSRVMETGGFKGRARELPRAQLYEAIATSLGVAPDRILNQYGMTELASQFYDSVLCLPGSPRRKLAPPWTRVRILDPERGEEAAPGAVGIVQIFDLANTGSILAIQTADLGRTLAGGFDVLGREAGAEARGCSQAADELFGA
ncbi:long-chain fatty acid--CoA ligase [Myxococcota bacterium]|nr:long-chain fatty acid--CoA ligase [Myxococcota bacterium]